jgi:adenine-specific DNA-methyltransferase
VALIDALLDKISDGSLRHALREQVDGMLSKQSFGLVFQQHAPETVELPHYKLRRGCKVHIRSDGDGALYRVETVKGQMATVESADEVPERWDVPLDNLVVVREFGDPIYPGLRSTGRVENGGDKPAHLVINAENFHALETLLYTHTGKVDAIYIDPPYNTRDKDWKYNNDYVDADDIYRHSKWLAMMQRRLELAQLLLKPDESVLIVTIDEKEYLRLGLLLEQVFKGSRIQMVSSVINRKGVPRKHEFSRVEEYLFFVYIGDEGPNLHGNDMLSDPRPKADESEGEQVTWIGLRRRGSGWRRTDRPGSFFPIFVDETSGQIVDVGNPLPADADRASVPSPRGCLTVWPLNKAGVESRWQLAPNTIRELLALGYLRTSFQRNKQGVTLEQCRSVRRFAASGRIGREAVGACKLGSDALRLGA